MFLSSAQKRFRTACMTSIAELTVIYPTATANLQEWMSLVIKDDLVSRSTTKDYADILVKARKFYNDRSLLLVVSVISTLQSLSEKFYSERAAEFSDYNKRWKAFKFLYNSVVISHIVSIGVLYVFGFDILWATWLRVFTALLIIAFEYIFRPRTDIYRQVFVWLLFVLALLIWFK